MDAVAEVRQFTRLVTQRVGALHDHYLARDRPLGEARLLWEIDDGADVRELRARLDLDSGYTSRLLRSLESAGLVTVESSAADRRVRIARLTSAGRAERAVLDERADALADSLLAPLNDTQRTRLVAAMRQVGRLLTAGLVTVAPVDPDHPHARHCLAAYFAEIDERFETGFDVAKGISAEGDELRLPAGLLLVATLHGEPVGCGALRFAGDHAYLKRMWVDGTHRGIGIGRRLLAELEQRAGAQGATTTRLETNRALAEAIGMYRAAGYREVEPFNDEYYAHHWFEKRL
ncbi:GNAT family N-acetyltransferase [Actinophytocola sp.]|uniref:bifunctional helix-turn-helix transcriptional regulator/GNAT family N-acetyltransferase n=1 Tax=Actinophytocola sp. TaxID=1872138 RepID=UPI00389A45A0